MKLGPKLAVALALVIAGATLVAAHDGANDEAHSRWWQREDRLHRCSSSAAT